MDMIDILTCLVYVSITNQLRTVINLSRGIKLKGARTCDGVVVLGRAEEEAAGVADLVAECLDGGREAVAVVGLEVGVAHWQVGDVDVLDAQPRDGVLAHLRGFTVKQRKRSQV